MADSDITPTEAQYKGETHEAYITYELEQETSGDTTARLPKVRRVYHTGTIEGWEIGEFEKQSGKTVRGVKIRYRTGREGYHREGYTAERNGTTYEVPPTDVEGTEQRHTKIVELPEKAEQVELREGELPERYASALQDIA